MIAKYSSPHFPGLYVEPSQAWYKKAEMTRERAEIIRGAVYRPGRGTVLLGTIP